MSSIYYDSNFPYLNNQNYWKIPIENKNDIFLNDLINEIKKKKIMRNNNGKFNQNLKNDNNFNESQDLFLESYL